MSTAVVLLSLPSLGICRGKANQCPFVKHGHFCSQFAIAVVWCIVAWAWRVRPDILEPTVRLPGAGTAVRLGTGTGTGTW